MASSAIATSTGEEDGRAPRSSAGIRPKGTAVVLDGRQVSDGDFLSAHFILLRAEGTRIFLTFPLRLVLLQNSGLS